MTRNVSSSPQAEDHPTPARVRPARQAPPAAYRKASGQVAQVFGTHRCQKAASTLQNVETRPDLQCCDSCRRSCKASAWPRTGGAQFLERVQKRRPGCCSQHRRRVFEDLDAADALELLAKAPDPARAAKLTRAQVSAALKRARRRDIPAKATPILAALRSAQLGQPPAITAAYATTVRSLIAVITVLNEQIRALESEVEAVFGRHPDAEIYLSQPGLGSVLRARVLGEFGDDPHRYASGEARKNYAGTSPLTRASGKKKTVTARFIRNDRIIDALMAQAMSALTSSPGARALYDAERARNIDHSPALRKVANRLVGIQHGCLKTRTLNDEATAWPYQEKIELAA